ncbi:phosphatase PAP2 family protein [Candidatus Gracilibacteria bacterium 28_42_T64]|nr:phosphatase PAP2 family protein [Candidatus Gracilibacteria bacterium 28_42_T64]
MLQKFNEDLLVFLNSLNSNSNIESMVGIFADAPIFFLPIFLVSTWIFYNFNSQHEKKEMLLNIFYSVVLAIIMNLIIQQIVIFDRPEEAIKGVGKLLLSHVPDASFPSDHAAVSFAFLFSLFFAGYKKIGLIFFPFVLLMNISRIIAGVHWPFDIIGGILVGFISSFIMTDLLKEQKFVKSLNKLIIKILHYIKL